MYKRLFPPRDNTPLPPIPREERFTFTDVVAMIIAILSLILPWVLGIFGVMALLIWILFL